MNMDAEGHDLWPSDGGPELEASLDLVIGFFRGDRGPRLCSVLVRTADARAELWLAFKARELLALGAAAPTHPQQPRLLR